VVQYPCLETMPADLTAANMQQSQQLHAAGD
jgi:hypothetical protein